MIGGPILSKPECKTCSILICILPNLLLVAKKNCQSHTKTSFCGFKTGFFFTFPFKI